MSVRVLFLVLSLISSSVFAEGEKILRVFLLAGQSNMEGHGKIEMGRNPDYNPEDKTTKRELKGGVGSLRYMATHPETATEYGKFLDADGNWVKRDDVFIYTTTRGQKVGPLSVGFGKGNWFGPELGFGWQVGDALDDPVLIIKTAWGGKDLAIDFRPPSSGEQTIKPERESRLFYREMLKVIEQSLQNFETDFPQLKGYMPVWSGIGWHQGWNDGCNNEMTAEYEQNLVNLIQDLRIEFGVESLPFVVANTGQNGDRTKGRFADLCQAQLNVGDPEKYPAFAGNVTAIDTRPFKMPDERNPSTLGYHWSHSAESHYLVGNAMGEAMVELIQK